MRASIMLLPGSARGEAACADAEQILMDISAAFGHAFSLLRGKMGSQPAAALPEETIQACLNCQAVFLCDAECPGAPALYDALDLPLRVRSFCIPEALCSRHESPAVLYAATVLSLDEETLRLAMQSAFRFVQEEDIRLTHVSPTGASQTAWEAAVRVQEAAHPQVASVALSAPEAISGVILAPERMGLVVCPPYAGGMLHAAATALCTRPGLMHDFSFDESLGVYAAYLPPEQGGEDSLDPFSVAYAVSKMLKYSLKLQRESACLEAAISNVLSNGWRTADLAVPGSPRVGTQAVVDLICEQIDVAGELMQRGGIA